MLNPSVTAIILSAGTSSRCSGFKPLYRWNSKTLLQHITESVSPAVNKLIIVTGYNAELIKNTLCRDLTGELFSKIVFAHNPDYEKGMFSSLQCGIRESNKGEWILYHFVDQPALNTEFYNTFIKEISPGFHWIQPVHNEQKGHPILFSPEVKDIILAAPSNATLRDIGHQQQVKKKYWNTPFPQIRIDIDTDEDWINFIAQND